MRTREDYRNYDTNKFEPVAQEKAGQLAKQQLSAYQCSARGGALFCRLEGERVKIGGHARLIASGQLHLP